MKKLFYIASLAFMMVAAAACQKEGSASGEASEADTAVVVADSAIDSIVAQKVAEHASDLLSINGVVVGGAMNSIMIEDCEGEAYDFSYPELSRDSIDAWEEGDLVKITYTHTKDGDVVVSVREIKDDEL
ncbi:MAG: hypothetical protein Q4B68_05555 [Bacteroidales bacterium]|nr:hypothetical protein [Bacteroidales bacterium]